jgi:hypothetical protein
MTDRNDQTEEAREPHEHDGLAGKEQSRRTGLSPHALFPR